MLKKSCTTAFKCGPAREIGENNRALLNLLQYGCLQALEEEQSDFRIEYNPRYLHAERD